MRTRRYRRGFIRLMFAAAAATMLTAASCAPQQPAAHALVPAAPALHSASGEGDLGRLVADAS